MNYFKNLYINKRAAPFASQSGQRGMALVMALVMLLVITILAVAMLRGTTMQERMAANNQQQTITFQAAEAAIRAVMDELRAVIPPPADATQSILITALNNAPSVNGALNGGNALTADLLARKTTSQINAAVSSVQKRTADTSSASGNNGTISVAAVLYTNTTLANGSSMGVGSGNSVVNFNFVIDSNSTQNNTGAASRHQQGVARQGPAPN